MMMESCDYRKIFDILPIAFFIVTNERKVMFFNKTSKEYFPDIELNKRFGEAAKCIYSKKGCGFSDYCSQCIVKKTIEKIFQGNSTITKGKINFSYEKDGKILESKMLLSGTKIFCEENSTPLVALSLVDITEIIKLKGLIPICANCKKIRNDKDYWVSVEKYLNEKAGDDILFSHGLCPECMKKLYPEIEDK